MFNARAASGNAVGRHCGDSIYHASLGPTEYQAQLHLIGFEVVAHTAGDRAAAERHGLRARIVQFQSDLPARCGSMGTFVFGMMQSLDGYIAGVTGGPGSDGYIAAVAGGTELPPPGEGLHNHFNDHVRGLVGMLYGRRMYEIMRYWDDDGPEFDAVERDFAQVWRARPKWVVSRSLKSVGPNATLVGGDVGAFVRRLKADVDGEIDVAGPDLAASLTDLGLVDEYRLYMRPFVLGGGKPYFASARPPLRLVAAVPVSKDTVLLRYVPA